MPLLENISLRPYNTFAVNASAGSFGVFHSCDELQSLLSIVKASNSQVLILGGGSNILLTKNYDGAVLKNNITGIQKIKEDAEYVYVRAGAGENWHQFVLQCIENEWAGAENLSLIPGNVGASPMQNIGAYGIEIKDIFHELKSFHLNEKTNYTFGLKDCEFGYRESVFKKKYKDQFVILNVTFKLRKEPVYNIGYGAIKEELEKEGVKQLSIKAISDAVVRIRQSKLPDPKQIGNAGSFFKNPSVPALKFESIQQEFPGIVGYKNADDSVKLAAGWMIEQCGPNDTVSWKGYRVGDAGCHAKQALVLVNYGNASGAEINTLADQIEESVKLKFGVELEKEVNII